MTLRTNDVLLQNISRLKFLLWECMRIYLSADIPKKTLLIFALFIVNDIPGDEMHKQVLVAT